MAYVASLLLCLECCSHVSYGVRTSYACCCCCINLPDVAIRHHFSSECFLHYLAQGQLSGISPPTSGRCCHSVANRSEQNFFTGVISAKEIYDRVKPSFAGAGGWCLQQKTPYCLLWRRLLYLGESQHLAPHNLSKNILRKDLAFLESIMHVKNTNYKTCLRRTNFGSQVMLQYCILVRFEVFPPCAKQNSYWAQNMGEMGEDVLKTS